MTEGDIQQKIEEVQYAATSGTGSAVVNIYNYYYREEVRTIQEKPADTPQDDLPSPYRGLYYFEPKDTKLFFGRDAQVKELVNATKNRNFIPILGASGSGKSSLVFAGLIPELAKQKNWLFTYFRLGSNLDPFYALAQALVPLYRLDQDSTDEMKQANSLAQSLRDKSLEINHVFTNIQRKHPQHKLLLFADQFEQLYTMCERETQHLFLDFLLRIIQHPTNNALSTVLVITMRADFLDKALSYKCFADALKNDIRLSPMEPKELKEVIENPAGERGVKFEEGLIKRILGHVYKQENNLPLLEFALESLWNQRTERIKKQIKEQKEQINKELTHADYDVIGEVNGVLKKYAEDFYNGLDGSKQEGLAKIFIKLVSCSQFTTDRADRRYVRRVAKKSEFIEEQWRLVEKIAEERLVVTNRNSDDEDTVEIIHEALIREWDRIETWMTEDRDFVTWLERLNFLMSQKILLDGSLLNEAKKWLEERQSDLTQQQQIYINNSWKYFQDQEFEERILVEANETLTDANQKAESKIRYGKIFLAVSIVLGAISLVSAGIAIHKQLEAQQGTKLEQAGVNALRQMPSGEIDALFSAMHAGQELNQMIQDNRKLKDYPAISPLLALQKIQDTIHEQNRIDTQQEEITSVSFSPNGKYIATAGNNDTVILWSASGEKKWQRGDGDRIKTMNFVAFSPDGKKIAAAEGDGTITLWDISGKKLKQFETSTTNFKSLSFSPDGKKIATADEEKARLWDLSGKQLAEFVGHQGRVNSISFSPNGQQIATVGYDGTIRLWDMSGKQLKQFTAHKGQEILSLSFSPDGKYLATAATENIARLWNLSGQELVKLEGHQGWVLNVSFSDDGKRIATTSDDGTVRLWDLSGKPINTLQGHRGAVLSASFSPDGKRLVSAGKDGFMRLWNLAEKATQQVELTGFKDDVNAIAFSPDGKTIAGAGNEGIMRLWDSSSGKELKVWKEAIQRISDSQNNVQDIAFSPDGKFIVAGGLNVPIARVWNLEGSLTEPQVKLKGNEEKQETHQDHISSVAVSPNSQLVATGSYDKTMRIWKPNSPNGELVAVTPEQENVVSRVVFTADDKRIVTADWDGNVAMWDLAGKQISKWEKVHQTQIRGLGITKDGSQIVTADKSGYVKILDNLGKLQREFFSYQSGINELVISPDGELIATGGMDGTVRLWDFEGRQVAEFRNPKGIIWGIAFSPDSQRIALAGEKGFASVRPIDKLPNLMKEGCMWLKDYLAIHPSEKDSLKICQ